MAHLNGAGDQNLVVNAPTLTACPAANPAFVHLDMLFCAATDAVLIRAHHSSAQFVENLKSCLIPRDPKLALKLDSRHAGSLAGDQVGGPKPSGQRRVAALHDRANRQPGLTPAFAACQRPWAGRDVERRTGHPTVRTDKTVLPAQLFKIRSTSHIIRKEPLIAVMLGLKQFGNAAITIAGIELMHRIRKGQFGLRRLGLQGQTAPAVWNVVLRA